MKLRKTVIVAGLAAVAVLVVVGCGGGGSSSSETGPIKIGQTLPLTGPLSALGKIVKEATAQAVADVNAKGGLEVGGSKRKVELVVKDNKSDPNQVTEQARGLVNEGAVALLGSFTPPLSIPLSNVAEQSQVPAIFTNTPVQSWQAANESGWSYAWDIFVNESQQTAADYEAANLVQTNKKVALFTDTEDDGNTFGELWEEEASKQGYEVAYRAKFPVGTTDFSQYVNNAKASGAETLFAIMLPPDGIALWKQMKALGWAPTVAACEKCSHTGAWAAALGPLAEGTLAFGFWSPKYGYPNTEEIMDKFAGKLGQNAELQTAAINYGITTVLLNAIERAGSTDPSEVNTAIGEANETTAIGPVKFDEKNTSTIEAFMTQWQGDEQVQVWPTGKDAAKMIAPLPGF